MKLNPLNFKSLSSERAFKILTSYSSLLSRKEVEMRGRKRVQASLENLFGGGSKEN
jgi:hypothetical protein